MWYPVFFIYLWVLIRFYLISLEYAKIQTYNFVVQLSTCHKCLFQQWQCKVWRNPSPKNFTRWPWPLTLKINKVLDSLKDEVCTKFGQNPLKDIDSRVFTRMLRKYGSVTICCVCMQYIFMCINVLSVFKSSLELMFYCYNMYRLSK